VTEKKARAREWKTFRKRHFFTQEQLAAILGISRRCLQHVESAQRVPHTVTLGKFEVLKQKHTPSKTDWRSDGDGESINAASIQH